VRAATFGFVALAAFTCLLPYTMIARYASATLAAGVGVQIARLASARPERWTRRFAAQSIALVLLLGVAAAGASGWRSLRERRAIAALPNATGDAPNVLLIILDTVRAANLSLYGYGAPTTPEIARIASEGVTFDRAFSAAPWTLPSHGSMFTGHWPSELTGSWTTALDDRHPTLAERFASHGYLTAGFVANHHYASWDSGLGRGFQRYEDYAPTWRQVLESNTLYQTNTVRQLLGATSLTGAWRAIRRSDWDVLRNLRSDPKHGDAVTREFLDWNAAAPRKPFFAFLNYLDAHQPTYAPKAFERFHSGRRGIDRYDAAIAYLDDQVGGLLRELDRRGILDKTIVIVASDHGELWGEHGLTGHAHNLYLPVLQVPLVIRYPARLPAGARVASPVSLRDLAATIVDLAALHDVASFPGTSLVPLATDSATSATSPVLAQVAKGLNVEAHLPTYRGPMRAAIDERMHYIVNDGDRAEELFDYVADSSEAKNLVATPAGRALLERYRAKAKPGGETER
jgi:arylsulfatase A-like enzyme